MNMSMQQRTASLLSQLTQGQQFQVEAVYIGQRIRWNATPSWPVISTSPYTISINGNGCAVLFRYGVVVMFNLHEEQRQSFFDELNTIVQEPVSQLESETVLVSIHNDIKEGVLPEYLVINQVDIPRIQVIAAALAKSTIMAYYEQKVAEQFDRVEPLAASLHLGWRAGHQSRELLKHIGESLLMESRMIGRAEVVEKPEITWDEPELDRFYVRLEDEFELHERYEALERKLGLINRTAETQLSMLHVRRSLRVEWYIVILIVIEIVINLFQPH